MLQHFQLPTRVSRLYPVFSLILLFSASAFFYAWQVTRLELDNLPHVQDQNKSLESQVNLLLSEQKTDKSALQVENQKIADADKKLADLEKQLNDRQNALASKDQQLKNQQDQLDQNASELERLRNRPPLFNFLNTTTQPNITQQEADVKAVLSDAYQYIQTLYDRPYMQLSITIKFVDQFTIPGSAGEIVITKGQNGIAIEIHLKSFDKTSFQDVNTIIHETIHGFHGAAVLDSSALEEGMTVAATDAVMAAMQKAGKLPNYSHLYLTTSPAQYDQWNQSLSVPADNQLFYSSAQIAKVYQLIGTAWYRLYEQDPDFFKKVNDAYYPKVQKGAVPDIPLILDIIRSVGKPVAGQSVDQYLATNRAFHPS